MAARATDVFAVMRDGMRGKVGVGKLALYGREYLVAVRPHQRGLVMHTLHHAAEVRGIETVDELRAVPTTVKPEEMKLARQVIATFEGPLNALKKSLDAVSRAKKKPARATVAKPAASRRKRA